MGRSIYRKLDWTIITCYIVLVLFGWINIYSSLYQEGASIFDFSMEYGKQIIWIGSSVVLALLILFALPPKIYIGFAWWLYALMAVLLVAVIFIGANIKGSHSWLQIGSMRVQPAEFSKITTSLALAHLMSSKFDFSFKNKSDALKAFLVLLLPMLTIILERETGTALVYLGYLLMFYREGMSGWILILGLSVIGIFIMTLIFSPYISILIVVGLVTVLASLVARKKWVMAVIVPIVVLLGFIPSLISGTASAEKPTTEIVSVEIDAEDSVEESTSITDFEQVSSKNENPRAVALKKFFSKFPVEIWLVFLLAPFILGFLIHSLVKRQTILRNAMLSMILGICLVFSVDFVFDKVLKDHQRGRIEVLLGMKEDPMGDGYNVHQSMIAIGSGGFFGKGFLRGTQTRFDFVPEQTTDFIFCTIGEEWGFAGSLAVLAVFLVLLIRLINSAEKQRDRFIRIYGYCVASILLMHILINVGMTIGLMPVIGIPLPFVSYGGSSLWGFTILLFIYVRLDLERWR
ncbi:MAG: rod shape-determining protein RodA [Bacteroidales bacterium]|nr:rod shape-determining protein RodA [Bacteroidales bacterium]